jgi:glutathione peroxidase
MSAGGPDAAVRALGFPEERGSVTEENSMSIFDVPINTLSGDPSSLEKFKGETLLIVNVASKCGLTPQYEGLEDLQKLYGARGFSVVGFPCNQFAGQEPGTAEEIQTFCSTTYGVTFPLFEKIDVNGADQNPIYAELEKVPDEEGYSGDVRWNFEKFLVARDGSVTRFAPQVTPDDPKLKVAIETDLD